MLIPWQALEAETLDNLITEYLGRFGTDNGDDSSLETRISMVRRQLEQGSVLLVFCEATQSVNLLAESELTAEQRGGLAALEDGAAPVD